MRDGYHEDEYGKQKWYKNDKLHREDGPAVIWSNGTKLWYLNGKLHREDGPAYIGANGDQQWYNNGKLHREDGPAVIWPDKGQYWYVNDKYITNEVEQWFEDCNLTYETMEFEDKMALKFFIRGLVT